MKNKLQIRNSTICRISFIVKNYKKIQFVGNSDELPQTATELIVERVNAEKEHIGLTSWEKAPHGKIVKTDVSITKNYLKEAKFKIVTIFFLYFTFYLIFVRCMYF